MQFQIYEEEIMPHDASRQMKVPAQTFGILRKQLVKNVGLERAQDLLFNFGYEMGMTDATELVVQGISKEELVKQGPIMHIENGQIEGIIHQCEAKMKDDGTLVSIVGQGEWIGSFEAIQHINWFGTSTKTVCSMLTGYASGFMSLAFNDELIAKELTCKGKGDQSCTWIIKTQRQWEMEAGDYFYLQSASTVERELKDTYDQLLEQRDFIKKLSDFQKLISDELLKGHSLPELSQVAVRFLGNPICIKDKNMRTLAYAGLAERELVFLEEDFDTYIQANDFDNIFVKRLIANNQPRKIDTGRQVRLVMPITLKGQLLAWVFFIYDKKRHTLHTEEELFIDRFATTVSLLLLNERTKFESFERMKGHFLDQLISNAISDSEIIKRGLFAGIDFSNPYHVVVGEFKTSGYNVTEKFEAEEQMLEFCFDYFHDEKMNVLVGHREGKIVLLISNYQEAELRYMMETFAERISQAYPNISIQFGISEQTKIPQEAHYAFKQAIMALRLTFTKKVVGYQELGLMSLLPKDSDLEWVRHVAKKELGALSSYEDPKTQELLKTLYVFLINGGNLDKTKTILNLSLSGLRHRIQNIERQLERDIRNPEVMYQLIFILKLLIISEELDFQATV